MFGTAALNMHHSISNVNRPIPTLKKKKRKEKSKYKCNSLPTVMLGLAMSISHTSPLTLKMSTYK